MCVCVLSVHLAADCAPGKYADPDNQDVCLDCPRNYYCESNSRAVCREASSSSSRTGAAAVITASQAGDVMQQQQQQEMMWDLSKTCSRCLDHVLFMEPRRNTEAVAVAAAARTRQASSRSHALAQGGALTLPPLFRLYLSCVSCPTGPSRPLCTSLCHVTHAGPGGDYRYSDPPQKYECPANMITLVMRTGNIRACGAWAL